MESPSVAESENFEDNFWGDNGLEVLLERLKHSKHASSAFEEYLKEKAKLAEEYGLKLLKLSKMDIFAEDLGTTRTALAVLAKETENEGQSFVDHAVSLRDHCAKPLTELQAEQLTRKRNQRSLILKSLKDKGIHDTNSEKCKEKYTLRCKEKDALMNGKPPGLVGKELEKYEAKLKKAVAAAESADQEYLATVMKGKNVHGRWVEDMRESCRVFQSLESERLKKTSEILNALHMEQDHLVQLEAARVKTLGKVISSIDQGKDIRDWSKQNSTGKKVPYPMEYVNFYTGSGAISSPMKGNFQSPMPASAPVASNNNSPVANNSIYANAAAAASSLDRVSTPGYASSGDNLSVETLNNREAMSSPAPAASTDGVIFKVKALYDYAPQNEDDLELVADDLINVLDLNDDPWWYGEVIKSGKKGLFPSNFVVKI